MQAEPAFDPGDDRRARRLRGVAVVADVLHGAAGGRLHLRLRQRQRRVLHLGGAGNHLRRLPRRIVPQVPLLRRRTVQPGRLRRLHRDVRGLRLGRAQKVNLPPHSDVLLNTYLGISNYTHFTCGVQPSNAQHGKQEQDREFE